MQSHVPGPISLALRVLDLCDNTGHIYTSPDSL